MSQAYPAKTAAEHLGIDHRAEPWLSWQINRAVMRWGRWVDNRLAETVEVADHRPRRETPTMLVPKYDYAQALGSAPDRNAPEPPEVLDEARALLSGALDLNDWMQA